MTLSGRFYPASAGESFDSIALGVYGDETFAAELMCANPQLCGKGLFTGGELLALPVVEQATTSDGLPYTPARAPWKS